MIKKQILLAILAMGCIGVLSADGDMNLNNACNNNFNISVSVVSADLYTKMTELYAQYMELMKERLHNASQTSTSFIGACYDWCMDHKFRVACYAALIGYSYVMTQLYSIKYRLSAKNHWSLWNSMLSFDALITAPQKELGQALVTEVQQRYMNHENPEDFLGPLSLFLKDFEYEHNLLKRYINLCVWIKRIYCSRIMFLDEVFYAQCEERLHRLEYIKSVFVAWVAEYKLMRNTIS